jgi:hypothetical protein
MKTSLLKLKQESNTYFDAHRQVKSFFWGDFIRLYADNQIKHSSVIIQPLRLGELSRSQVTVQLVVTYSDRIFSDFSNLDEVHSEAADVLNDFVMVLNTSPRWKDFVLGATNGNAEFFTQRSGDLVAGAAMIVNVRIKSVADLCAIPATDYDFEVQPTPLPDCADVTVVNSNGEYSVQVTSGGLLTLPDTPVTVTDQNGNELAAEDVPSVTGGNIEVTIPEPEPCAAATYQLTLDGEPLEGGSGSIPSGENANIPIDEFVPECEDATAVLIDTATPTPNTISTTPIASGASANITAPDGTVTVNRDGVFFADVDVRSNGTASIDVPSDCPTPIQDTRIRAVLFSGQDEAQTLTIAAFTAGTYTSFIQDGASGTVTFEVNSVLTALPFVLSATDELKVIRTNSTADGFIELIGTY